MRNVYSKAAFCIAATSAQSGDVGLFVNRDAYGYTPVTVEATWPLREKGYKPQWPDPGTYLFGFPQKPDLSTLNYSALNKRAWVAQERFLSQRILHFTDSVLFWECHTSFTNENSTNLDFLSGIQTSSSAPNALKRLINHVRLSLSAVVSNVDGALCRNSDTIKPTASRQVLLAWEEFLELYTRCDMTKESDVLVALTGIAEEVGSVISDRLVAGLWRARLIEEMCWGSWTLNRRPVVWRAPSWSWASVIGPVSYRVFPWEPRVPLWQSMSTVIEVDVSTKPSGEIERGSILLECRCISASIIYLAPPNLPEFWSSTNEEVWPTLTKAPLPELWNPTSYGVFPIDFDAPNGRARDSYDVQLIVLLQSEGSLRGICVVESSNQPGAFERIGSFNLGAGFEETVVAAYKEAGVQKVLLV